jgi:hypothetical protein
LACNTFVDTPGPDARMSDQRTASRTKMIEWITAFGVILSLLFVGVQIRQNTNAVRIATYQDIADQALQINLTVATNPNLATAYTEFRGDSIRDIQETQVRALVMSYVRTIENAYYMSKLGSFEQAQLRRMTSNTLYTSPNFARFWESNRDRFDADFRSFMDSVTTGGTPNR